MDKYWVEKAHRYIVEHNSFDQVSDVKYFADYASISATVSIGLPGKFIKAGITAIGVMAKENVNFIFTNHFPLEAPKVILRDDFPRFFPHINPSKSIVNPCIYEGNLSELLQQSEWMNGYLNQLVDWLEKAASNDLLNYEQGWEPMRNDDSNGFMLYDIDAILSAFSENKSNSLINSIEYEQRKDLIVTGNLCNNSQKKCAHVLYLLTTDTFDKYLPNSIVTLNDLYTYCQSIGLPEIRGNVENNDLKFIKEDVLFLILAIKRPVKIIGSNTNIEFLNFVIYKSKQRQKKGRSLKRTLPDCKVSMLTHIADRSPNLLKRLSGTQTKLNELNSIALVGCGSLGSKIGMHLARNGNGPFMCIDNDIFMPHNNARHALTLTWAQNKADLLSLSMFSISKSHTIAENTSAFSVNYSKARVIIDTTASLSVRHFLMGNLELPPIISGGLYNHGKNGVLFVESKSKTPNLTDLWAYLYFKSIDNVELHDILYSSQEDHAQIGQGCSSHTTIVDDAKISLFAATMSLIIQQILENDFLEYGNIHLLKYNDNHMLSTEVVSLPRTIPIKKITEKEWQVSLLKEVHDEMMKYLRKKAPCETGGVLLGSVLLYAKKVVISGILPAPPDSIEKPNLFVLGTEGLEKEIKRIEQKTNGKVTYLGTWHTHPFGGNASPTDNKTYNKLLFVRNYEPTVCLILTPNEVIIV